MSSIREIIEDLNEDTVRHSDIITESWNRMMLFVSIRGLTTFRIELLSYIEIIGEGAKVKKHTRKLNAFFQELIRLENIDLNSKTYIKEVLSPLKAVRKEFAEWRELSVTNIVDNAVSKAITKRGKEAGETVITKLEEVTKAA